jgi:hypothetical protein
MCTRDASGGTYSATRYAGTCDPDGCDFNSHRTSDTTFYVGGMTLDTTKMFTVVAQFIDNPLTEIKRFYVQNGKLIPNSQPTIAKVMVAPLRLLSVIRKRLRLAIPTLSNSTVTTMSTAMARHDPCHVLLGQSLC